MKRDFRAAAVEIAVTAVAFVVGASVLAPGALYGRWFDTGPTRSLDRPCAGVSAETASALVPAARRSVDTRPDGWSWTCRWRSTDDAALRTTNPTLVTTATRWGRYRGAGPVETAAKEYAYTATSQVAGSRFGADSAKARAEGLGVSPVPNVGDRAQLYVAPSPDSTGREVRVVALRGNVVVSVRLVAYRTDVARMRDLAIRAAAGVVGEL